MQSVIRWQAKQGSSDTAQRDEGPVLTQAARLLLLLDGIKLIGTGNGAGALASVAALYYFSARSELHLPMKIAAIFFVSGLLVFALAVAGYVSGLIFAAIFFEEYASSNDGANVPVQALNKGIDGLMLLGFSLGGAVLSWGCFLIGLFIGLYALICLV
jgi:hypothetical protein